MLRNRALIYRILRYALSMTISVIAPAYALQSFDSVAAAAPRQDFLNLMLGPAARASPPPRFNTIY